MSEWTETVDSLIGYLRYRQECGDRSIEMDPAVLAGLTALRPASRPVAAPVPEAPPAAIASVAAAPLHLPKPAGDSLEARQAGLAVIAAAAAACQRCARGQARRRTDAGQGNPCAPEILFVNDAPGDDESAPAPAGAETAEQLLSKMIVAMGFTRSQVFIASVCKCRSPHNRPPTQDEMQACLPFLRAQVAIIKPKTIVALGAGAVKGLLDTQSNVSRLRGQWTRYGDVPLMPTFHPAYLLRYPTAKKNSWEDLKAVLKHLGRQLPARSAPPPS
jgi:DNA polymerase